jgi:hypothetical protein
MISGCFAGTADFSAGALPLPGVVSDFAFSCALAGNASASSNRSAERAGRMAASWSSGASLDDNRPAREQPLAVAGQLESNSHVLHAARSALKGSAVSG